MSRGSAALKIGPLQKDAPQPAPKEKAEKVVAISRPNFQTAVINIRGTTPYVQNKFSTRIQSQIVESQEAGQQSRSRRKRDPKNFDALCDGATHYARQGWRGIPCSAFRNAAIDVCRLVGFKMTIAKMSIFIEADGFDRDDDTPLVRITGGEPHQTRIPARNATGTIDIRARPMWDEWTAKVRVKWDADQFSAADVVNLFARAGQQCGVGAGRPNSKESNGVGWGTFEVAA